MTIGWNIWMICLKLNRFSYGLSRLLHLSEFVWILRSSVLVVFNNFHLIGATDRSKISSDQKRFFIAFILYPLSFFANTPFNCNCSLEALNISTCIGKVITSNSLQVSFYFQPGSNIFLAINCTFLISYTRRAT